MTKFIAGATVTSELVKLTLTSYRFPVLPQYRLALFGKSQGRELIA
jgi:hypothetical protein